MLLKSFKSLVIFLVVGPLILVSCLILLSHNQHYHLKVPFRQSGWTTNSSAPHLVPDSSHHEAALPTAGGVHNHDLLSTHNIVYSVSTRDRKYFVISFGEGEEQAINPSIIPHPILRDTWIITAQQQRSTVVPDSVWYAELVCEAQFTTTTSKKGATTELACARPPKILPIAATAATTSRGTDVVNGNNEGGCVGDLAYFALNIGPHDARVFYGPELPYAVYGSNSAFTCFGQWIHDFRMLVDWGYEKTAGNHEYRLATELKRPPPVGAIEKNWFLFWDKKGGAYVHYDIYPTRAYAKLESLGSSSGSVGQDLAPLVSFNDEACMARYMPKLAGELESIHQATNSLSITLCERSDLACEPDDSNTFIMTIFQHKSYYSFHSVYEPYVMLFKRTPPFEIHAISSKPIWIHGRAEAGQAKRPDGPEFEALESWSQSEMFYVTSISWKSHSQKYDGYIDDIVFINFGIEDKKTAGIDVVAGDLLKSLGLCPVL
jgi:hypothetical protein